MLVQELGAEHKDMLLHDRRILQCSSGEVPQCLLGILFSGT